MYWKYAILFCCNPKYYKHFKSRSKLVLNKRKVKNDHNNEKILIQLSAIDINDILIKNKTFNQINAINNNDPSVTNQTSSQINESKEGTNNILTESQTLNQINAPNDDADQVSSVQENLSSGNKFLYSHCPKCQEQLTVGFQCRVCENYYYGNCQICNRERTGEFWCQYCESLAYQKNFEKWTSGNKNIDALIQRAQKNAEGNWQIWEWIPYTQFTDIERLDEGGFATVYLATWLDGPRDNINRDTQRIERRPNEKVILKVLHKSQNINAAFLREVGSNYTCRFASVGWVLGITQDPTTNEYTIVMRYYEKGDLRKFLKNITSLTWKDKLNVLRNISFALSEIHKAGLLHRDLHPGNIYQRYNSRYDIYVSYLGDLGLCTPANESPTLSKVYGVLPYIAPEVLLNKPYTCKSDIYSFGIIMSEVASGKPPFPSEPHDSDLVLKICRKGARPEYPGKTPKFYVDIMKKCWDQDPSERPTAEVLYDKIAELYNGYESDEEISKAFKAIDEVQNDEMVQETSEAQSSSYTTHPEAVYTSRLLSTFIIE